MYGKKLFVEANSTHSIHVKQNVTAISNNTCHSYSEARCNSHQQTLNSSSQLWQSSSWLGGSIVQYSMSLSLVLNNDIQINILKDYERKRLHLTNN